MKIIIISDSPTFVKEPIILMLEELLESKRVSFSEKEQKFIKQMAKENEISHANKVRLRSILSKVLRDKPFVEIGRELDITAKNQKRVVFKKDFLAMLNELKEIEDSMLVLLTEALDLFVDPLIEDTPLDTVISETMLVADKKFTGEFNFILDEDFLLKFFRGLKREKNDVFAIGDVQRDSYLLSLADKQFDLNNWRDILG